MKEQKKCVPEIRFAGFTDDWEQRKLGEVVNTFEYGLNVEAKAFDGVNKYIRITDIDDESRKFLQKDLTSPNIDIQKALEYKLVLGDILFARTGASVGKTYLFDKKDGSLYFAGFLIRANIKESFNANFIFQNTLTKNFDNFVSITSQRSGQPGINAKEYASFEFLCPSLAEQTAIGNFFKQLDDTIALHQRTLEKYQKLKISYLEKMFPKENEQFPELRFPNFTDAWEQRKLLDVIEGIIDFRGKTPKKLGLDWSERGYLALSALNVKNGYIDKNIETYFGDEILYQKWMGGSELTKGQVLFTTEAPMGNVAQVPDNEKYILSQRTIAFNVKSNIITDDFLAVLLRSPLVFNGLETLSSGGTAKGVSQKSLSNLVIKLPNSLMEQTAIGNFFKQLDDTIALHQRFWVNNNQFGREYAELF